MLLQIKQNIYINLHKYQKKIYFFVIKMYFTGDENYQII